MSEGRKRHVEGLSCLLTSQDYIPRNQKLKEFTKTNQILIESLYNSLYSIDSRFRSVLADEWRFQVTQFKFHMNTSPSFIDTIVQLLKLR